MFRRRAFDLTLGCVVAMLAAWFLPREMFPAAAIVALAGAAGLLWRRPYVALCLALVANIVADVAYGVLPSPGQEWNIAAGVVVATSLGAFTSRPVVIGGVVVLAGSIALQIDSEILANWAWASAVLGCVATVAALIARSGRRAQSAWTQVEQLASTTPEMVARRAVAEERMRLTADIHLVVRNSVLSMREYADTAAATWSTDARPSLRAIQDRGRQAIGELRRLLGLLREEPDNRAVTKGDVAAAVHPPGRSSLLVDSIGGLGAVLLATSEYFLWGQFQPPGVVTPSLVATVLAAATFGLRGTSPGMGALLCGFVFLGSALVERPVASGIWCFAVVGALPWTAMYRHRPVDIIGVVVMLACQIEFALRVAPDELTFVIFTVVAAGVSGHFTARRVALTRRAARRSARLTTERAVATERAVRAERLTLARDLHDVVSHAVVLMVVQAGAAEALLATRPVAARQSLELVRSTADATLEELDRLLSAMRDDGPNTAAAATEARSLRALVERMRAGGLDVDFDQQGRPEEAPSATVYRIVQETLTNALRHAPRAHVEVRVASRAEETTVEVVDDGPGAGSGAYRGYGLIGMAERVERAGGTIYAGPGYRGSGFRVCATFPALREGAVVT